MLIVVLQDPASQVLNELRAGRSKDIVYLKHIRDYTGLRDDQIKDALKALNILSWLTESSDSYVRILDPVGFDSVSVGNPWAEWGSAPTRPKRPTKPTLKKRVTDA